MKKNIYIVAVLLLVFFTGCEDWLEQNNRNAISIPDAYSSSVGINSIAANLYSRLQYRQDFPASKPGDPSITDDRTYDLCSWDEAINNSDYWAFATNKNRDYRQYYDYTLVREINLHLNYLIESGGKDLGASDYAYYMAEARYMRAYVYFTLVSRMGGVPIIDEVLYHTNNPLELAKPRDTEARVYEYVVEELDDIMNDLAYADNNIKARATKGTALALKTRAMLYAGTIAYNYNTSSNKGLVLPSGATGIPRDKANGYLQKCLDAYFALEELGVYSLYNENSSDKAGNYAELFINKVNNKEVIFWKDYNGTTITNPFTGWNVPRAMSVETKAGAEVNPTLNLVDSYEMLTTHATAKFSPYTDGGNYIEELNSTTSDLDYIVYDNPEDIFAGRDPRLAGTVLYPGSSFRDTPLDFQAGLAERTASGYTFRTVAQIENVNATSNYYQNVRMTGIEGPHRISTYVSHSGFLLRKYVDTASGSEANGASTVPYIVFRYGEVLLNAAEAAFYLSENGVVTYNGRSTRDLALELINRIRNRAGGSSFEINASELTLDRIINERRVELAFEDHRYNDLKRWRIADEVWAFDRTNENAVMYGLWPYKIYAPGDSDDGKWIYRKVRLIHRGNTSDQGMPINFDRTMYYATYPINEGNPYVEKNPNH